MSAVHVAVVGQFHLGAHRAHAINVVKTAGGFARLGCRTTLLCRLPKDCAVDDALRSYGESQLEIELAPADLPCNEDPASPEAFARWAMERLTALAPDAVYARHFHVAVAVAKQGLPTALETHAHVGDRNPALLHALGAARDAGPLDAIITISPVLADYYMASGAAADRVHIVPDGVDMALFEPLQQDESQRCVKLTRRPRIVYAGHLYRYKGVYTLLEAAALSPECDVLFVGGAPEDVHALEDAAAQGAITNARCVGMVAHAQLPEYLWSADVLVLPPSANHPSARWTSPVKLGEYLASGRPIVASRIEALERLVEPPLVHWCKPDDPADMAKTINTALRVSPAKQISHAKLRQERARAYAYPARAQRILDAMRSNSVTLATTRLGCS